MSSVRCRGRPDRPHSRSKPVNTYLVGGAIRDELLGLPVTERDWVVVGATPEDMASQGFPAVGRDFPVYLHPKTREEYALARTERKTGKGHRGFDCDSSTSVTLEEDLQRRDFTINAIARDENGELIDPWNGTADLEARILRHVSPAFEEDPLRVLRAARFMAKLRHLDFRLHEETTALLREMVSRGDLDELTPERVWAELEKALETDNPEIFFGILGEVGADRKLWPEITPAGMELLSRTSRITAEPESRFAALCTDLSGDPISALCRRIKAPGRFSERATLVSQYYETWKNVLQLSASDILNAMTKVDAIRRPERFTAVSQTCRTIAGTNGLDEAAETHERWMRYRDLAGSVKADDIGTDVSGPELGKAIRERQIEMIANNQP
ncbi:MAG: multifunctional CCA tRNA nucleotidyl transferase/2'3'-cyclic phosphodiesterase/2'nucleotidase/phosphatase [Pseudomonadales bacterium]|nr:multifunctional CCA tRNA nucleotidyl transferase/2'3'-cyclic phosphodiesterase/2'nucleotidase/phosphatase [Pseudomonadales bacterium]